MNKKFYITTTAPYVNSNPHIGFALEIVQADVIARYHQLIGDKVLFGFGTDEHGLKIYRRAMEESKTPQQYCDEAVKDWLKIKSKLHLSYTNFIRTTDPQHIKAAQELWRRCDENGDIYKKNYRIKYCVGCELEKTDSELIDGKCPIHPNLKIELIDEENYFFRFSKYQKPLLDFYKKHPRFVVPKHRFNEIRQFVESGLQDFSVSRLKEKMPWGVDVPNDPDHVMYVWFDALTFYISNLGWPNETDEFKEYWPGVQVAGKDNLRQQTAIWQAMLISAGLPNSKQVFIHGFINSAGQKMSKSLGNVIDPFEVVQKYGVDATRYYLLSEIPAYDDGDFTFERFEEVYNADLANGLGNVVSRIAKLCEISNFKFKKTEIPIHMYSNEFEEMLNNFQIDIALSNLWQNDLSIIDKHIDQNQPWSIKNNSRKLNVLQKEIDLLRIIAWKIRPFLPETSEKILKQFSGPIIKSQPPLFPRIK